MKNKSRSLMFVLAVCCLVSLVFACVCGFGCGSSDNEQGPERKASVLSVEKSVYDMKIGETDDIVATGYERKDGAYLVYTSSDTNVALVDQYGKLTAYKEGTATITVQYGEATATATVNVGWGNENPRLRMNTVIERDHEIAIAGTDPFDLQLWVYYNKHKWTDVEYEFTVSNPTIGNISNGNFVPTNAGTTSVTVKATWRDKTCSAMEASFNVTVNSNIVVNVNGGSGGTIVIYTLANVGSENYNTSSPFNVTAYKDENGVQTPLTPSVSVAEGGENFVEYDAVNHTVSSKGLYGTATINITCNDGGINYLVTSTVQVEVSVGNYSGSDVEFSALDGSFFIGGTKATVSDLFGESTSLISAYDEDENALTVGSDNAVLGLTTPNKEVLETTITLKGNSVGYRVPVTAYRKIITQASDLAVFNMGNYTNSYAFNGVLPTGTLTGYYVLGNDIDASTYTFDTQGNLTDNATCTDATHGFRGTFDGRGYTISGITFGNVDNTIYEDKDSTYFSKTSFSLFGSIGVGATVKNFGLTGVKFNIIRDTGHGNMNAPYLSPLAMYVYKDATVENVYIDIAQARGGHLGSWATSLMGFAYRLHPDANISNVIIDTKITDSDAYDASRKTSFVRNLRSGTTVDQYTHIANTYVISDFTGSTDPLSSKVSIYPNLDAMVNAGNDYSSFSSDYWDVTTKGIPLWKGIDISEFEFDSIDLNSLPVENYSTPIEFSAMHGDLPVTDIFGEDVTLIAAKKQDGTKLKLGDDGKSVKDIKTTSNNSTETINITVYSETKGYNLTLNAYAGIIREASDLAVFNLNNTDYQTIAPDISTYDKANPHNNIKGYYVLGNNIDASGYTFDTQGVIRDATVASYNDRGFNGTFDGRGYTISGITFGNAITKEQYCAANNITMDTLTSVQNAWKYDGFSLFGIIGGKGVVKNFALTGINFNVTWESMYQARMSGLANLIYDGATVENVYIDIANAAGGHVNYARLSGLAYCVYDNANISNVIVDSTATLGLAYKSENTTALSNRLEPNSNVANYTKISDTYCISSFTDTVGATIYADVAAMNAAANDYSSFSTDYWDTTSGIPVWKTA